MPRDSTLGYTSSHDTICPNRMVRPVTDDLFQLNGKIALVTGASGGLGCHFAKLLAKRGATVILTARRTALIEEAAEQIRQNGGHAHSFTMDVTDERAVSDTFAAVESRIGTADIVINNSGIVIGESALKIDQSEWDRVIDTNLRGVWTVAREAGKRLVAGQRGGSLINVASILGLRVAKGVSSYAISKAGVIQMTRALSLEWARYQIRVNAIAPGFILTDFNRDYFESGAGDDTIAQIPQRRIGVPSDLDGTLLLLASDASSYMTGSVVVIDGGHLNSSL